jgi:thiamine biosynthesis protein ThiS
MNGAQAQGAAGSCRPTHVFISVNGEPHELLHPLTIAELLASLAIDPRRVAVVHNLEIIRRQAFVDTTIREGDRIEIVSFVGGG